MFAAREQFPEPAAQSHLRAPRDVANWLGEMLLARPDLLRDLRSMPIGLGRFDEHPTRVAVARLRDPAEAAPLAARVLARCEPEITHELARIVEAREVPKLSDSGDGHRELHAAERLQCS